MRGWMAETCRSFTVEQLYEGVGALTPGERFRVKRAMRDFLKRREIERLPLKDNRRQIRYRYNHKWKREAKPGGLKRKILKAMYVSGTFATTDIRRLSEVPERSFIDKLVARFVKSGLLRVVGRRPCAHGAGAENLYHIADRMRFRIEVME